MGGDDEMGDKTFVVKSQDIHLDSDYREWIAEIKQRYQTSLIKAAVKVKLGGAAIQLAAWA